MHCLLETELKTKESFLDGEGKKIDITEKKQPDFENIVQEGINNTLKQEFKKEKDFESFMKINKEGIRVIKDYIKEKIS